MTVFTKKIVLLLVLIFYPLKVAASLPEIIPHRGGKAERPENIIPSFQDCVLEGVKTLELDVQVTKDGVVVAYHPKDLSVNTNGSGVVSELTYNDIQKLDAAYNFKKGDSFPERGKGLKVPRFEDILIKFPNAKIIVDLKSLPADTLIEAIAKVAKKNNAWGRLIFYSTNDEHLLYLKERYPQTTVFESRKQTVEELLNVTGSMHLNQTQSPVWLGFELVRQLQVTEKLTLGDATYPVNLVVWTKLGIERIRKKLPGAKFVIFGVNTVEDYQKAADLGAYAVYSDTPSLLWAFAKNIS